MDDYEKVAQELQEWDNTEEAARQDRWLEFLIRRHNV